MSTNAPQKGMLSLTLDEQERSELLQLLEVALGDLRVEAHRTHTPDYRDQVLRRKVLLQKLIEKFRQGSS
jgi:hypothetical protein